MKMHTILQDMHIQLKRIYEEPESQDGYRVLVTHYRKIIWINLR